NGEDERTVGDEVIRHLRGDVVEIRNVLHHVPRGDGIESFGEWNRPLAHHRESRARYARARAADGEFAHIRAIRPPGRVERADEATDPAAEVQDLRRRRGRLRQARRDYVAVPRELARRVLPVVVAIEGCVVRLVEPGPEGRHDVSEGHGTSLLGATRLPR